MKKRLIWGFLILLCLGVFAQTPQTKSSMSKYEQKWKEFEKFESDDLPKSASKVIDQILEQAVQDKNTLEAIKALIYKNKYKKDIDGLDTSLVFADLEDLLAKTDNAANKSLLHSILAELYLNYVDSYTWEINQRTSVVGFVPDDVKEWSKNIFHDNALSHMSESVKEQAQLLKAPTKEYQDVVLLGADSQKLMPTLYDFLVNRAIVQSARITTDYERKTAFVKSLQAKKLQIKDLAVPTSDFIKLDFSDDENLVTLQYYKELLQSLTARNNNEAIVHVELNRNEYLSEISESYRTKYANDFLLALEKKNQAYDYNVEIINALIDQLQSSHYDHYRATEDGSKDNGDKIYEWCKYGIDKYPNYDRINLLKQRLASLESPSATIVGESVYHPDNKSKKFKLTYKNLNSATIKILNKKTKAVVATEKLALTPKNTYSTKEQEFTISLDALGDYLLMAEYDKKRDDSSKKDDLPSFSISRLASFARVSGDEQYEFYVVDRLTGTPVTNATITFYSTTWNKEKYTKLSSVQTDSRGLALFNSKEYFTNKNDKRYVYRINKDNDLLSEYSDFPYFYSYNAQPTHYGSELVNILTDRSIYRPGQTTYFKAIATKQVDKNTTELNVNKSYKVSLVNVNNQLVHETELKTNDFGSLSGQFVLPNNGLTGQYRLVVGNMTQTVSVEEYKRPTFQITFDKLEQSYAFGDKVKIVGRAENFSGVKVQDAIVEYNIVKTVAMGWWWIPSGPETVDNGTVVTKEDGSFEILFTIPQNEERKSWYNTIFNFSVEASVTDLNGETQTGMHSFAVGDASMVLSVDIPIQLDKDSDKKLRVKATNLNGDPVSAKGSFTLYSVLPNDSIKAEVHKGVFSSDADINLMEQIKKLPSAKYLLSLNAKDDKQRDVVSRNYFILYSADDKHPPIETNEWLIEKQTLFSKTKNVEIILGVSANEATILYDLVRGYEVLDRQQFKLSNSNKKLEIPYKDEYGDNITVALTYVVDEKAYSSLITLTKEEEDATLNLKLEVFRDKLRPGQHEEWRISVKDSKDKPAMAELLASMYDSSLDKLQSTVEWEFRKLAKPYIFPSQFGVKYFGNVSDYASFDSKYYGSRSFEWDYLNWFGYNIGHVYVRGRNRAMRSMSASSGMVLDKESVQVYGSTKKQMVMEEDALTPQPAPPAMVDQSKNDTGGQAPQIRSNFNETAFFYPHLKTNEKGETIISFTVPESNTTWKFRALAYDKSLKTGKLEALTVSRKELMVTPNMPRFMRQGDKTSISTKISNLSDKTVKGKVRIEFFDPLTDEVKIITLDKQYQDFSLEKNASGSATWLFDVPADIEMIGCRIIAESESFSDGEQHVVSVLPNRMLVTESMTMNINGEQTKKFVFDKLVNNQSKTLSNYRLTLEYAGNPAWYAVQALPSLSNPTTSENSVSWFASYYVNTLGSSIMQQYPKVSNMIKAWKQQGGSKETLVSKLQKNEELKSVLLEETPWVLEAKDETDQMNRLSILFDLNNTKSQTEQAINKLKELQNAEGGWSWYKGMYSNRSITQYILYGFTQLINLNAVEYPSSVKEMQMSALKYLDKEIKKDFDNLKKYNKQWEKTETISTNQLEYLFVRSGYRDIPISQESRAAERFYTSVVEKNWTKLSLYEKSLSAVLCQKNGNKDLASKIMKSVREYATTNEEMGMFWANNTSRVFMSQSAVAVHSFIISAFCETGAPVAEMDMLKQWLLKQKQTQKWESTHATIDAIYALLSTGSDWLASSGDSEIRINKQVVETKDKELGTGYINESWSGNQITKDMGRVEIEKRENGPAWGSLYWQYYEDLDKITTQKGELNVDKKLFVEKSTEKGKTLVEVTEKTPLKVGDKAVMRLTVRVDRDMEFVHLKDMRASCFEPIETISGLRWQNATYYYQSTKDASTNFFFDHLARGTYVFEYPVYVNRSGEYSNGITTIQCMYAPEFVSHTAGIKVVVK